MCLLNKCRVKHNRLDTGVGWRMNRGRRGGGLFCDQDTMEYPSLPYLTVNFMLIKLQCWQRGGGRGLSMELWGRIVVKKGKA